jgi:glycosidase
MTRDHARTPMQWTNDAYAGFSTILPWIKVNPNTKAINVQAQENDPYSILTYTKELVELYKKYSCFAFGHIDALLKSHPQMIGIRRYDDHHEFIIYLNLSKKHARFIADESAIHAQMLMTNYPQGASLVSKMIFRPYEARIYQVK